MPPPERIGRLLEWIRQLGHGSHSWRFVRRVVVGVTGGLVLLTGVLMLVLPGPAMVVIPLGLAILALEFSWAARLLREIRRRVDEAQARLGRPGPADRERPVKTGIGGGDSDGTG